MPFLKVFFQTFTLLNYLGVIVGALLGMIIGFLWYGPIFGKLWSRLSNITPEMMAAAQAKGMRKEYMLSFGGVLLTALSLDYIRTAFNLNFLGLMVYVLFAWLGLIVPSLLNSVLWEGKNKKVFLLNIAERLVTFLAIAKIVTMFR